MISKIVLAQEGTLKFKGEGMYFLYSDPKTLVCKHKIPVGKNVQLTYDTFFKSWRIEYTDESGTIKPIKLTYVSDDTDGINMLDTYKNKYKIMNLIEEKKKFVLISDQIINGLIFTIVITEIEQ